MLGEHRVVPSNFYEIQVNEAALQWLPGVGRSYDEVIKQAANEAGGNAFVTDYVGPASIAKGTIDRGTYDVARLAMRTTPPEAISWFMSKVKVPSPLSKAPSPSGMPTIR